MAGPHRHLGALPDGLCDLHLARPWLAAQHVPDETDRVPIVAAEVHFANLSSVSGSKPGRFSALTVLTFDFAAAARTNSAG
jgi:hypothetical protein